MKTTFKIRKSKIQSPAIFCARNVSISYENYINLSILEGWAKIYIPPSNTQRNHTCKLRFFFCVQWRFRVSNQYVFRVDVRRKFVNCIYICCATDDINVNVVGIFFLRFVSWFFLRSSYRFVKKVINISGSFECGDKFL